MTAILGKDANGNIITIDKADRREGLYIIGSSGTGKSTLLTTLIQSDITDNIGLCLLDPHGDLIQRTIELMPPEKYKDVILLEIANPTYAFGVNLFHCKDTTNIEDVENIISQVMHLLDKVYSISTLTPMMNNYFLNLTQTLLYNPPSSILDIPRLLGDTTDDKKYRAKLSVNVPNIQTQRFWASFTENRHHWRTIESIDAVKNKLDDFFRPVLKTIFGQEITTINMREIMDDPAGKILLVKMNARWESITKLVGSVIVGQILDAAYSRADIPIKKRRHFSLYADEFQWFASQDFSMLFSEARKYGIGLTIAHQTLEQVDPHIIATCKQAKTIISFRVSGDNAESLSREFQSVAPPAETRREAILVPKQNVIDHILNHGHPNPHVSEFVITYLQLMKQDEKKEIMTLNVPPFSIYPREYYDGYQYDFRPTTITFGLQEINNLAYRCMTKEIGFSMTDLEGIARRFADMLGFINYFSTHIHPNTPKAIEAVVSLRMVREESGAWLAKNTTATRQQKLAVVLRTDETEKKLREVGATVTAEKKGISIEEATALLTREVSRYQKFIISLMCLLSAIIDEPILTESGRFEEKPLTPRTLADVEKGIANMLTSLPNMHAYARVGGLEHTITVEQINRGMHRQALSKVIANITEQNVEDGYIRLRSEVEAEIETRQNPPEDPPPSHTSPNRPQSPTSANRPPTPPPTPRKRKIDS